MARDLAQVLSDEGDALVAGRFERLKTLAEERESILAKSSEDELGDAAVLRKLAERNLRLAQAAARGLGAARARALKILRGASLDTYSQSGERSSFRDSRPTLQRRA